MSVPNVTANRMDPAPFYWAVGAVALLVAVWSSLHFVGEQRFHNTAFWQRLRPVVMRSPPQVVRQVDVRANMRDAMTTVQTPRGVYFLSGVGYAPAVGQQVVVQANDHWELYLCTQDGAQCLSIHSFCAEAALNTLKRDAHGRVEGCYAPRLVQQAVRQDEPRAAEARAAGPGKRMKRMPPAMGLSHPREWAWRMGLPATDTKSNTANH